MGIIEDLQVKSESPLTRLANEALGQILQSLYEKGISKASSGRVE